MSSMSRSAVSSTRSRRCLRADMRSWGLASLEPFLSPPFDLVPDFVGEFSARTALKSLADELAQSFQLCLVLFVKQPDRRLNSGVGVGVPATLDEPLDLCFGLGRQRHAHANPPSSQTSKAAHDLV